jgi:hypothetical protein
MTSNRYDFYAHLLPPGNESLLLSKLPQSNSWKVYEEATLLFSYAIIDMAFDCSMSSIPSYFSMT